MIYFKEYIQSSADNEKNTSSFLILCFGIVIFRLVRKNCIVKNEKWIVFPNLDTLIRSLNVKNDVYNAKMKNIEDKVPDITNLATNTTLNTKTNEVKGKMPIITNSATTAALITKINEVKKKVGNI